MQWYCTLFMKNSVLDSYVCSWTHRYGKQRVPRTHKLKIVNESLFVMLLRLSNCDFVMKKVWMLIRSHTVLKIGLKKKVTQ